MKDLKNVFIVSLSTVGSRISGLFRDISVFTFLGASALNSAFLFAFTLPNLFRRMLGEGALSSALIPIFSEELEQHGREGAFRFFNRVCSWALVVLVGVVVLCIGSLWGIRYFSDLEERWYMASDFGVLMMPYMIFVCLAAVVSAVLNVLGRFGVPALSAVWLNLAMIASIGLGAFLSHNDPAFQVKCLCIGVLVGGGLQLMAPVYALLREGWKPQFDLRLSAQLVNVLRLFLPGVIGAAIFQINIGVSRLLAFSLDESAVSITYLANRLIEFPLGVFSIAIATVFFPSLARFAVQKEYTAMGDAYGRGMRLILAITVPAAIGLMMLREPVLRFLFEWGHFGAQDVSITEPILLIFCIAIPFYSFATFITRGFHAVKDTRTPVKLAFWSFIINFGLTILFMKRWGVQGLAAANVVSVVFQAIALHLNLERKEHAFRLTSIYFPILQVCFASILVGLYCSGAWASIKLFFPLGKMTEIIGLILIMPSAVFLYYCLLGLVRFREQRELNAMVWGLVKDRFRPRKVVI